MIRNILIISSILIFLLITVCLYLIILGSSKNKSDIEKQIEDKEQMEYLKRYQQKKGKIKMEKVFIDREYAIAYVAMAIDSIWNSANKERTMNDFVEEIKTMTEVHTDEKTLKEVRKNKILDRYKIKVVKERKK